MARKEIILFGTSFLDLLSGALAAVIILFIIVPKMTSEQQKAIEELEQLNVQVENLTQMMERLQHSVPQDVYEQIRQQLETLQNTVQSLQNRVESLQRENTQLRQQNTQLQQQNNQLQQQMAQLEQQLERANQEAQRARLGRIFGLNAELGVVCKWKENVDVDLYVKNLSSGEICCYRRLRTVFGNLSEDITSRTSSQDDRYELFYQSKITPGRYLIYINIYNGSYGNPNRSQQGSTAHVDGYVVMFPETPRQIKIPFPPKTLTQKGVNVTIGTLVVSPDNIQLQ